MPLWAEKLLLIVVMVTVFCVGYMGLNAWNQTRDTCQLDTALDRAIPFTPEWHVFYALIYLFVALPVPIIRDRALMRRTGLAYLLVMLVSFIVFALLPVSFPRPDPLPEPGNFWTWAVYLNYAIDQPNNCFPSLHIAFSYLVAFVLWRTSRPVGAVCYVLATGIALSTLFVKQHYIADVVGGFVVAAGVYWFLIGRTDVGRHLGERSA